MIAPCRAADQYCSSASTLVFHEGNTSKFIICPFLVWSGSHSTPVSWFTPQGLFPFLSPGPVTAHCQDTASISQGGCSHTSFHFLERFLLRTSLGASFHFHRPIASALICAIQINAYTFVMDLYLLIPIYFVGLFVQFSWYIRLAL